MKPPPTDSTSTEHSDELATGLALYAVGKVETAGSDRAVAAAQLFLKNTQLDVGSWPVRGTKATKKGSHEETAGYRGTAWATMGLLENLPTDGSPRSSAAQLTEPTATAKE